MTSTQSELGGEQSPSLHFQSHNFTSPQGGVRMLITGAVHGNEICGTEAIRRVMAQLESGELLLQRGSVTFVPVANPLAYQRQQREGDRNLNRRLRPTSTPQEFEDHVANWLCPLMQQHEVLLDLHSFRGEGQAFVMVGPENNQGEIEAFSFSAQEEKLAQALGVQRFVDGWLTTYAKGVARRRDQITVEDGDPNCAIDAAFGMGTTEYMRSVGGYALTLECGQHQDPKSKELAYQAIINAMTCLQLIAAPMNEGSTNEAPMSQALGDMETLRIYEVVDKQHDDDRFVRAWASFDILNQGDVIGVRHDGTEVRAEMDARIIFPDANAKKNDEWFYLAKSSQRLQRG
ncbi:succinylglutamate desuccinylase [Undibacterium sp. Ji22W]|uniref:succinylglutamate desuccinylase n=1 Tax=Undibacterium sp. Ji22W TaxID=3413038 RepID=UPI003BEF682C